MDDVSAHATRRVRRVQLALRAGLYSTLLALVGGLWWHHHQTSTHAVPPPVSWVGTTSHGERISAITVDGELTTLRTRLPQACTNGSTFTLRLALHPGELRQHGPDIRGRQGPRLITSDSGQPTTIDTKVRGRMDDHPDGSIIGTVIRDPGRAAVQCSRTVTYTLHRAPDP